MEQIKIIFFALASFFGIENGRFVADKTTITVYPEKNEITIVQENLFTIIQSEDDKILALEQWDKLINWEERKISWSKELDSFPVKSFNLILEKNVIQPHLIFSYSKEKDLRALGIWYSPDRNEFTINNIPQHNIKTKNGKLTGRYWSFKGDSIFSFTIEPFLQIPDNYQKLKIPLKELLVENKND